MPKGIFLPLDVDFASSDDLTRLFRFGRDARALRDLLVQMWCYCKRHQSDGNIPAEQIGILVYPDSPKNGDKDARRLVEIGIAERTDTGYFLPDYLKHNKSRAQIEADSQEKARRGRVGGIRSGLSRRGEADAKQGASTETNTETETYTETEPETSSNTERGDRNETLRPAFITDPTRCIDHQTTDTPPPCGGCKTAREADERRTKITAAAEAARAANCRRCGGTNWIEDVDGRPARKCNHLDVA